MKTRIQKTDRQKLIKINDILALKILRTRRKNRCEKCGSNSPSCNWHHVFSRRYLNVRWDEENLLLLCFGCHMNFAHSRVEEFRDWMISRMGEVRYMLLKKKALTHTKFRIGDLKMVQVYLEKVLSN